MTRLGHATREGDRATLVPPPPEGDVPAVEIPAGDRIAHGTARVLREERPTLRPVLRLIARRGGGR
jgi:hypothetical protein